MPVRVCYCLSCSILTKAPIALVSFSVPAPRAQPIGIENNLHTEWRTDCNPEWRPCANPVTMHFFKFGVQRFPTVLSEKQFNGFYVGFDLFLFSISLLLKINLS